MNREEFLRQLEKLLSDIPECERREAIEYYQNYFEDAGPEMEEKIIEELGSPQEVAASIKKNLFGEDYKEYDFINEKKTQESYGRQEGMITRRMMVVIIVVLTFPLWVGIAGGAFGILVGGIAAAFGVAVAFLAVVIALLIVGFLLIGIGFANIFTGLPAVGLILISVGMFLLAFAVLGCIVIGWIFGSVIPWALRTVVRLCKKPFQKRGALI